MRPINKRKAVELSKKETQDLLRSLGKEDRIKTVENSTSNKVLTDIITEEALSKILDISVSTLRAYRKKGLPYIKVGNKTYFSQKSVYIWLLTQEKGG